MHQINYNYDSACQRIDELYAAAETLQGSSAFFPYRFMQGVRDNLIRPNCLPFGNPTTHRLLEESSGDSDVGNTEVEFRLIGSVEQLDLPPFERRLLHLSRIRFLQQRIGIAAPTASKFRTNMTALIQILELIGTMAPHQIDNSNISSTRPVFGNRLFSARDYTHEQDTAAMPNSMDPTGELTKAAALAHLVHAEENSVEYLRVNGSEYVPITPVSIHCGDIVEIRFGIVLFHTTKTSLFSKLVLRAIISLDTSFAQALRFPNAAGIKNPPLITMRRKRVRDSIAGAAPITKKIRLAATPMERDDDSDQESSDGVKMMECDMSGLQLNVYPGRGTA